MRESDFKVAICRAVCVLGACLALAGPAAAQTIRGTITGTVED